MDNKALGTFLAELRKEKKVTQRELAEFLCVSDKTVSHWERGENSPDLSLIPVIADYFGVSCDEILRGERKDDADTQKAEKPYADESTDNSAHLYITDTLYKKFVTKNYISIALSIIALLCGLIADYYLFKELSFLIFLALLVVPVLLAVFFRSNFSVNLNSPYTDKEPAKEYFFKANRVTANNLYFSFGCFVLFGMKTMRFYVAETILLALALISAAGAVLLTEFLLRKFDIVKKSGTPLEIKKVTVLRIVFLVIAAIGLFLGAESQQNLNRMNFDYEYAEYIEITDKNEFIEYIGTYDGKPENYYYDRDFSYSSFDKGEVYTIEDDDGTTVIFTYNNLKVADVQFRDGKFIIFTHEALLEGAKKSEEHINKMNIVHIVFYFVFLIICFALYKIIKSRLDRSMKKAKITLIKDF